MILLRFIPDIVAQDILIPTMKYLGRIMIVTETMQDPMLIVRGI